MILEEGGSSGGKDAAGAGGRGSTESDDSGSKTSVEGEGLSTPARAPPGKKRGGGKRSHAKKRKRGRPKKSRGTHCDSRRRRASRKASGERGRVSKKDQAAEDKRKIRCNQMVMQTQCACNDESG